MKKNLIAITTLCSQYKIELSFIDSLNKTGLIKIEHFENNQFIHEHQIGDLEKIIRLYYDLNVNIEGIDVVFNLLDKEKSLRDEINTLKNRLKLYEND